MANLRSKLTGLGCAEVAMNSLKIKGPDKRNLAAVNVKKPKRAGVNYCPQRPKGDHIVIEKMEKTFSYRRQEEPMVAEFKSRWPALFNVKECVVMGRPRLREALKQLKQMCRSVETTPDTRHPSPGRHLVDTSVY